VIITEAVTEMKHDNGTTLMIIRVAVFKGQNIVWMLEQQNNPFRKSLFKNF
jgi:hypothetical protein